MFLLRFVIVGGVPVCLGAPFFIIGNECSCSVMIDFSSGGSYCCSFCPCLLFVEHDNPFHETSVCRAWSIIVIVTPPL